MGVGAIADANDVVENVINLGESDFLVDGVTCIYLPDRGSIDIGWVFTAQETFAPPAAN